MMKITLKVNGKLCDYFASVTARKCREAYAIKKKVVNALKENSGEYPDELLEEMTGFVVEAFDRQFTAAEYLDGYEGWFFDCQQIIDDIMNNVAEALEEGFPKKTMPQATK